MEPVQFIWCSFGNREWIERWIQSHPCYTSCAGQLRGYIRRSSVERVERHRPTVQALFARIQNAVCVEVEIFARFDGILRRGATAVEIVAGLVTAAVKRCSPEV